MKNFILPFSLFFVSLANYLNAQHCAQPSGSSVCTPIGTLTQPGFYPPYDSLPCAQIGVPYDQVIHFRTPAQVVQGGSTYDLNWVEIDTVTNMPCGLCWRSGSSIDRINGNSTGCIRITGTTYDAPGQYKIRVIVTANVQFGIFPVTVSNQNAESLGLKYFARVEALDGSCPLPDTLATGNTATTPGSISAISLSGGTSICSGQSSTFSIANAGSYYAYKWSTGAITSSINVSTGGTYTVTAYAACTSATASRTLTVNSNPTPTVTANGPTTFCAGSSVILDAGAGYSAYSWSNGGSGRTINVSQSGTYSCTVTQNGCTGSSNTVTVTVNNNPAPTITPGGATTFCDGGSVSLDAGSGYSAYSWSTGETTQAITASQSGSYTVTVTQNGCNGSSGPVVVTENANPSPTVTANGATTFCTGGSVTLNAGAGYSAYSWSSGETSQSINVTQSGNYTCTVTQNGCTGGSNTVTVTVNNNPSPIVTASGSTSICLGDSVILDAGAGYSAYSWSNGGTSQTTTVKQTGDYTCTVTENGCTGGSNLVHVDVTDAAATINANGPTTFCTGGSVVLDAGPGFSGYLWSDGVTSQTNIVTQSGTYDVTTTLNSCTAASNAVVITVTSNTLAPVITASPSLNICPGGTATLDAGSGYDTYLWSDNSTGQTLSATTAGTFDVTVTQGVCSGVASAVVNVGNFPVSVSISPAGPVNACEGDAIQLNAGGIFDTYAWSSGETTSSIQPTTTGSYILTVTSNSCIGTDTVEVTVNPLPQPAISPAGPVSACNGDMVMLDVPGTFDTYLWSNSDNTSMIHVTSSASYAVTVTLSGCSGSDTVLVTFNAVPSVTITPSGPVSVCEGTAVTLDAGAGFSAYAWSSTEQTQSIQPTATGTYSVTVTENGCDGTASVSVTINAIPQPAITPAGPVSACAGDNVILDAGSGYSSYNWSNGDLIQTTQPTATGTYTVDVTQNGCTGSDTVIVTFYTVPHATITPSGTQNICTGDSVVLDAGAGYSAYLWTGGTTTQTKTVTSTGTYDVTVTANGCSGASANPVTVFANITPNASINILTTETNPAVLQASPAGATYQWLLQLTPNGPYMPESSTSEYDTVTCGDIGEYHTVVVTQNGCSDTSAQVVVVCVGISDLADEVKFRAMPNPASDVLNISYSLSSASRITVSVSDITGRRIIEAMNETQQPGDYIRQIQLGSISSGIYLLGFSTATGSFNSKFVKE